ncbi:MAG: DUF4390 domain-containing protein [Thermodesulfobacteriota bacterium]
MTIGGTLVICLAAFLALLLPAPAMAAKDPTVVDVRVERDHSLKVSFSVENAFSEGIEEAVMSGIPTSFTFIIELDRARRLWFDKHAGSWRFKHTVKYDTLKEEYEITLGGDRGKAIRTSDPAEMRRLMATVDARVLTTRRPLRKGRRYTVGIKAELHTIRLPFRLDYPLFFLKFWDLETDWFTYRFTM